MADYDFMAVWTLYCMCQPYWVCGFKGYLVHTTHIPPAVEWKIAYMAKFGVPCSHNRGRPCGRLWFHGSSDPKLHVASILDPWVQRLFGTHNSYTPCCGIKNRVYGQVWGALVPTNASVPMADYDFMAVWTLYCMCQPYWVCGSKGYLVHTTHIPPAIEWKIAYMAKFGVPSFPQSRASLWQIMILRQFGRHQTVCTSHIGSVGQRAIWYIKLIYPLLWN